MVMKAQQELICHKSINRRGVFGSTLKENYLPALEKYIF